MQVPLEPRLSARFPCSAQVHAARRGGAARMFSVHHSLPAQVDGLRGGAAAQGRVPGIVPLLRRLSRSDTCPWALSPLCGRRLTSLAVFRPCFDGFGLEATKLNVCFPVFFFFLQSLLLVAKNLFTHLGEEPSHCRWSYENEKRSGT